MSVDYWFAKEFVSRSYDSIVWGSSTTNDGKCKVIVRAGIFKEEGVNKVCLLGIIKEDEAGNELLC